jgi:TolA-binding protein
MSAFHRLAALFLGAVVFGALMPSSRAQGQQANAYADNRLNQFERSVSDLRAKLEQLRQQNQRLQQDVDKMRSSYESRLQALEKGGTKPPAKARTAKP